MEKVTDGRWIKVWNKDNKYVFKIYPHNNKNQELGTSKEYATCEDCKTASEEFIHFVLRQCIKNKNSKNIQFEQYKDDKNCWHYRYICVDDTGQPVFYQSYVGKKTNAQNGVASLYNTLENAYGGISKWKKEF